MVRRSAYLALAAALAATLACTSGASASAGCHTPAAPDGHEPPCNPALAASPWSAAHRGNYAQASSPFDAPRPDEPVSLRRTQLVAAPIILDFTSPYPDGGADVWMSALTIPDRAAIFKLDAATGAVIDDYAATTDEGGSAGFPTISGAYSLVDRDNHLIVARADRIDAYGDAVVGDRLSPIALLRRLALPAEALCRPDDKLVGITMLPDGKVAFATELGMVGVVPREPARMQVRNLRVTSLNGDACADESVSRDGLEQVSNSIAGDEHNGIYVVTSHAQYKLRERRGRLRRVWRARYLSSGSAGGARLGAGSGSTPSLMGTDRGDDRFVVITDGQQITHLDLFWRDRIPNGWTRIAPGKPRRLACEVPITFGDPIATETNSEQSVLVRGYGAVAVNNRLSIDALLGLLPQQIRPVGVLSGQITGNEPHGAQRVDWHPRSRTCATRWANAEVSIPNGIPTMSARTGLMYGIGLEHGSWGLLGLEWKSGRRALFVAASPNPQDNSFFAATTIGPSGSVWTGTFGGVSVYRPDGG